MPRLSPETVDFAAVNGAPVTLGQLAARRLLGNHSSCTVAVRTALHQADQPMLMAELAAALGHRWPLCRLSSVLSKMREHGEVVELRTDTPRRFKRYAAAPTIGMRHGRPVLSHGTSLLALDRTPAKRVAGPWDALVPALPTDQSLRA